MTRKKTASALALAALSLATLPAFATAIETFDSAASALSHGFELDADILYIDPGRPYLGHPNRPHSITYTAGGGTFTFESLQLNAYPAVDYYVAESLALTFLLEGAAGEVLDSIHVAFPYDPGLFGPSAAWLTYASPNPVQGVHKIVFPSTAPFFWPSFDNLSYSLAAAPENPAVAIREPGTALLFLAAGAGAWAARKMSRRGPARVPASPV